MRRASVKEEIIRCAQDPIYFINTYVKIRHPKRGLIAFKTFPYQNKTIECFLKRRFNVVLKARQMGFTEITSAFITWLILFHPNQSVLGLATKGDTAKQLVRRVRVALKNIPRWLLISDIATDNKMSIELANGSFIKAVTKSADAGRSEALSLLVIDEAAHIAGFDEIWTGIRPTVSAGGRIIMLSTPNGVGNVFHKTYIDATSIPSQNEFNAICVYWWEHPEHIVDLKIDPTTGKHTSTWFRHETKGMTAREIAQEYECAFLGSGDTFFSADVIELVIKSCNSEYGLEEGRFVFQEPLSTKKYIMGVDSATGTAFDRGAIHVFDIETMDQVAETNMRLKPAEFAEEILELGAYYNDALLVVENNAVGLAVLEHIKLANYPNVFYSLKGSKAGDKLGEAGAAGEGSMSDKYIHGISTQGSNRPFMLNKLEELIRTGKMRVFSPRFKDEMETFIWNNGRPEARHGRRDDLIMAAALAVWVRDNHFGNVYNSPGLAAAMLKAMSISRSKNTQINGASKDPDLVPGRAIKIFSSAPSPFVQKLPNGKNIDLMAEMGMYAPRRRR